MYNIIVWVGDTLALEYAKYYDVSEKTMILWVQVSHLKCLALFLRDGNSKSNFKWKLKAFTLR